MTPQLNRDIAAVYADFAHGLTYEHLPGDVVELTKKLILDQLGVMLVGSAAAGIDELLAAAREWGGAAQASVLVHGDRLPAHHAALINGTMARAHDFDAFHESAMVHATAGCLPQCLALAERRGGVTGKELITAMALGMEVMLRLGLSFETNFLHTGRVTTLHLATFGGALAGAKLLNLDPRGIVSALGLACGQVAGNLQVTVEGTVLVRVLQGFAAQTSVLSAVLAEQGLQGPERVFLGEFGYFKAYHENRYRPDVLDQDLGVEWRLPGISIKHYPCCFLSHFATEAMRRLVDSRQVAAENIEAIKVRVTQGTYDVVCAPLEAKRAPATTQEALFSLPYAVACAAIHGNVQIEHMRPAAIADARVRALAQTVSAVVDEELERDYGRVIGPSIIEVALKNGRQAALRVDSVKGHPSNPMTFADCEQKFWSCAPFAARELDRFKLERCVDDVRRLDQVDDVSKLVRLLS
ncbi:MAG TPA: MmgE/PrpD family protein [Xanthobacteraceae bacterium]|nr:MmgE/PrpD family protein [Xanthobacteraceae bacterium]